VVKARFELRKTEAFPDALGNMEMDHTTLVAKAAIVGMVWLDGALPSFRGRAIKKAPAGTSVPLQFGPRSSPCANNSAGGPGLPSATGKRPLLEARGIGMAVVKAWAEKFSQFEKKWTGSSEGGSAPTCGFSVPLKGVLAVGG